jgi:hypothetical protein
LAITAAIIAAGFALFGLATKYLPIFPSETEHVAHEPEVVVGSEVLSHAGD